MVGMFTTTPCTLTPWPEPSTNPATWIKLGKNTKKSHLLTFGRFFHGDIYAKAYYMLGKIAEQQGDKARARENYRKFLDLWKDADPGLPEPVDAHKRLEALQHP